MSMPAKRDVNAFVPLPGQSLNDMVPPHYASLFDQVAAANGNAVMLPFEIWREERGKRPTHPLEEGVEPEESKELVET